MLISGYITLVATYSYNQLVGLYIIAIDPYSPGIVLLQDLLLSS
jgi:hypothetical protein